VVCQATRPEQAAIVLWDTLTWRPVCKLESHALTVTQLAFSHDGRLLLSVSRDRTWTLFTRRHATHDNTGWFIPVVFMCTFHHGLESFTGPDLEGGGEPRLQASHQQGASDQTPQFFKYMYVNQLKSFQLINIHVLETEASPKLTSQCMPLKPVSIQFKLINCKK